MPADGLGQVLEKKGVLGKEVKKILKAHKGQLKAVFGHVQRLKEYTIESIIGHTKNTLIPKIQGATKNQPQRPRCFSSELPRRRFFASVMVHDPFPCFCLPADRHKALRRYGLSVRGSVGIGIIDDHAKPVGKHRPVYTCGKLLM